MALLLRSLRVEKALLTDEVRIKVLVKCYLIRTREKQGTRDSYIVRIGIKNSIELIRMAWMMGPDDRVIGPDDRVI